MDWEGYLKTIEKGSIDFVLIDPPYNILDDDHDTIGDKDLKDLAESLFPVMEKNSKIAIF